MALDFIGDLLGNLFGFGGEKAKADAERAASEAATAAQERIAAEELQYQREAGLLGFEGGLAEQRRRQQEAAFRAGKLEDVVGLFENLQGPQFQAFSPTSIQATQVAAPGPISAERVGYETLGPSSDVAAMRELAQQLSAEDSGVDLRRAAMRELDLGGESLNAMLAAQGVRGSGYGAMQARGMAGDVMSNLARDISQQRMQALTGAANIYQGAGGLATQREMSNQEGLLRAALANQQAGLQAGIATGEMGMQAALANQGALLDAARANQAAELQAAGMSMDQAQALANFQLAQAQNIGNIYSDEAFGANAPLDLSREEALLEEYRRRWNVPGGNYGPDGERLGHTGMDIVRMMAGGQDNLLDMIGANRPPPPATVTPAVEPRRTTSRALENPITPAVEPRRTTGRSTSNTVAPAVEPRRTVARSTTNAAREREDTAPTRRFNTRGR